MLGFLTKPSTTSTSTSNTPPPSPTVGSLKKNGGMRLLGSSWKAQASEDTQLLRNRRLINKYLRRIGKSSDQILSLDSHGLCCLPFKKFILIIEVPEDDGAKWFFYAKVFDLQTSGSSSDNNADANTTRLHQKRKRAAVQWSKSGTSLGTKGATLGLDGNEVNLCFSMPVMGLQYKHMKDCMEDFIQTAVEINARLTNVH